MATNEAWGQPQRLLGGWMFRMLRGLWAEPWEKIISCHQLTSAVPYSWICTSNGGLFCGSNKKKKKLSISSNRWLGTISARSSRWGSACWSGVCPGALALIAVCLQVWLKIFTSRRFNLKCHAARVPSCKGSQCIVLQVYLLQLWGRQERWVSQAAWSSLQNIYLMRSGFFCISEPQ